MSGIAWHSVGHYVRVCRGRESNPHGSYVPRDFKGVSRAPRDTYHDVLTGTDWDFCQIQRGPGFSVFTTLLLSVPAQSRHRIVPLLSFYLCDHFDTPSANLARL